MKKNLNLYLLKAYNASARVTHDKIFLTISLLSLLFVIISTAASAQTTPVKPNEKSTELITGVVRDDEQQALVGVSVFVKGTTQGVLTDENGRFSISVDVNTHDVLQFSYIAKKSSEISIAEKGTTINLTLYNDPAVFTELVVTGAATDNQLYTEKKADRKRSRTKAKRLF